MSDERIYTLQQALDFVPDNHELRRELAKALISAGRFEEGLSECLILERKGQLRGDSALDAAGCALELSRYEDARRLLLLAEGTGATSGLGELRGRIYQAATADSSPPEEEAEGATNKAPKGPERAGGEVLQLFRPGDEPREAPGLGDPIEPVTFVDVGGLESVKKTIHRLIILPRTKTSLFARFKRKAGGSVLLYGPPGSGKTLLARATAGECKLPFYNIRIENILNPFRGVSESNLHSAFEEARANAPCVLFIDELDALAFSRRKQFGDHNRALVDQLLQELDAIGGENTGVLILAATNAPWDVDDAARRPGRFDRQVFVPPPDLLAREVILQIHLRDIPHRGINFKEIARKTSLYSGADLRELVARSIDGAIDEALDRGTEPPVSMAHVAMALRDMRPSTLEWLARARNYVEFANQGDLYKDIRVFLKSREARSLRDMM